MTVIAWDGKTLAADRMMMAISNATIEMRVKKIRKIYTKIYRDGFDGADTHELLVGFSGKATVAEEFFRWIENGMSEDSFPENLTGEEGGVGIVIYGDKNIEQIDQPERIVLDDEAFDKFEQAIENSKLSDNEALKKLRERPKRWG